MTEFNPYEAPAAVVEDLARVEYLELADRGTRLAAKILDGLVGFVGIGILAALLIPMAISQRNGGSGSLFLIVFVAATACLVLTVLIWNLIWLHRYGQTIGKRIVKVRIVRSDGERADLGRIVGLRIILVMILGAIPLLGPLFSLVNVCFIFRDDRRCIHDLMADTIVVKA